MANGRTDPLVGFHYGVEIQGMVTGFFTECSGLGSEHDVIEHKVVDEKGKEVIMKIPGRLKWENIVLKRGITGHMDIWKWRQEVENGETEKARRNGTIWMLTHKQERVARWDFERGWPVKISGPSLKADSNEIGIEELTIAHEYIRRKDLNE